MKATLEQLEGNKVRVNIKVDSGEVAEALQRAYRKVVRQVRIPGFRKGKAPRAVLELRLGPAVLHEEAIEDLVPSAYADAVEELELEPIDQPHFDIVSFDEDEGFEFTADVEVKPEVTLGDYRAIRVDYEEPQVGDEDVEEELDNITRSAGQLVTVEDTGEGLDEGQYAVLNFEGFIDGEPIEGGKAQEYVLEIGSGSFIKGFEEQLVGMHPGDERHITVTFPDDYGAEQLAGQEAQFQVELLEIKEHQPAELDKEFLERLGPYESVEALKEDLRKRLQSEAERKAEREYRDEVIDRVVEKSDVLVPEVLVNRRIDELVNDLRDEFKREGLAMDDYLEQADKTMDELRRDFHERAQDDVKTRLVLEAVAEAEDIEADPEDLEAEVSTMARVYGQPAEAFRPMMLSGENAGQLRYNISVQKTIDYLVELARGTDPSDAKEEAARKYRTRLENIESQAQAGPEEEVPGEEGETAGAQEETF